jgi:hypothetical protein
VRHLWCAVSLPVVAVVIVWWQWRRSRGRGGKGHRDSDEMKWRECGRDVVLDPRTGMDVDGEAVTVARLVPSDCTDSV